MDQTDIDNRLQVIHKFIHDLATSIGFVAPYVPEIIKAVAKYYTVGPINAKWSLEFHLAFSLCRFFVYTANKFDNVISAQRISRIPPPNFEKVAFKTGKIPIRQEAIDFMLLHADHNPISSKNSNRPIPVEWVSYDSAFKKNQVIYILHGLIF